MTEITQKLEALKRVKNLNKHIDEVNQEELMEIYNKEKVKKGRIFEIGLWRSCI